jgi:hypothetical protein
MCPRPGVGDLRGLSPSAHARARIQSNQFLALQADAAVLADDDVVMHGDAELGGDLDGRFGCKPADG